MTVHRIAGAKKALDVCRLVESLYLAGKRVVVFIGDRGKAGILDGYLWTFSQPSFVPHSLWNGAGPVDDPVVLVSGELANPNGAEALVIADRLPDPAQAQGFAEIHDVVAGLAEDQGKPETWKAAGFTVKEAGGPRRR